MEDSNIIAKLERERESIGKETVLDNFSLPTGGILLLTSEQT